MRLKQDQPSWGCAIIWERPRLRVRAFFIDRPAVDPLIDFLPCIRVRVLCRWASLCCIVRARPIVQNAPEQSRDDIVKAAYLEMAHAWLLLAKGAEQLARRHPTARAGDEGKAEENWRPGEFPGVNRTYLSGCRSGRRLNKEAADGLIRK